MDQSPIRSRIPNACDGCKARKVRCDGNLPCTYCTRRQRPHLCRYSAQKPRRRTSRRDAAALEANSSPRQRYENGHGTPAGSEPATAGRVHDGVASSEAAAAEEETDVPREARLHTDSQGKLLFIGDCAPLSFFQSVRQLITSRVGPIAFAPESSRFSVLVNAPSRPTDRTWTGPGGPHVAPADVEPAVAAYLVSVAGLVDFFEAEQLQRDILQWSRAQHQRRDSTAESILYYLVLSIGIHGINPSLSQAYFDHAHSQALAHLSGDFGIEMIQAFTLITIHLLCTCQINSAFLFFGLAARAAYSIGLHRTEVNARFGAAGHRRRDRLWKSLRVVDLYLSTALGRPPGISDVDCTVPYRGDADDAGGLDLLGASVQIFLIVEGVVVDIYSKRKISLQLTEGISLRLREWSGEWLDRLKSATVLGERSSKAMVVGATQVLATYYYAVMLVSRPFLMYELCRRLEGDRGRSHQLSSGRSKLADACIDAASLIVEMVSEQIDRGALDGKVPLIVSWLFAASLVFGLGLLGGFGRLLLEKHLRASIRALDHFARSDAHAHQYSLIAQSLLRCAVEHLERSEGEDRRRRAEASRQLFGLAAPDHDDTGTVGARQGRGRSVSMSQGGGTDQSAPAQQVRNEAENGFVGFTESLLLQQTPDADYWTAYTNLGGGEGDDASALNLFPLLDGGGGIDLAHYFEPGVP